ncbi:MAG TPA: hypothetical protein VEJ86_05850, partial [Candidatus Binataceae bacterium]|nr:hypothetical protein [Candidatus Binataceae bacterium]
MALAVALFLLSGCVEWSEDPQGNLNSVGLPGIPLWQSNRPPAPITPMDMGFTPEEAAKLAPPVLVEPPTPPRNYRYRW